MQTYLCLNCGKRFSGARRARKVLTKNLWNNYVFGKQTVKQLSVFFNIDKRKIRELLNNYRPQEKQHRPRPIHLAVDGTYLGERKEGESWCTVVARDPKKQENLLWSFEDTETTGVYLYIREQLEALGYTILSVTGDGFGGIKTAFFGIPYQMCHVHMERIVIRGTTRNPQTEAGQVLLALVRTLFQETNSHVFHTRLKQYIEHYRDFLNEKTIRPDTFTNKKGWSWTHEDLRRAVHCLIRNEKYLFTYEHDKSIPKITNSLEGHFRHIKKLLHIHHGTTRENTQKIIHSILLASTTSPNKKRLDETL